MTDDPSNKATMILDTVKFGSKANAGKGEVKLTFNSRDNPQLNQFLIEQAGNPVDLLFGAVQGNLELVTRAASNGATPAAKDEPDAEITDMIVNGEPAKVRRPRKSSNGNGAHAAGDNPPYSYHAFIEDEATPGLCGTCHKRPEDAGHELAPWPEGDKPLPHAFRHQGRSNRCGWCHLDVSSELHTEGEAVEAFTDGDAIGDMAQRLIDSIEPAEAVGAAEGA